jgi:hypothetical protein
MGASSWLSRTQRISAASGVAALVVLGFARDGALSDRLAMLALVALVLATASGWLQLIPGSPRLPPSPNSAHESTSREWLLVTLVVAVFAYLAAQTWFRPGTSIATIDITPPDGTAWVGRVFDPWTWTGSNLGEPSQLPLQVPWAIVLGVVHALGGEPFLAQRIWYTALFMGAALAAVGLVAALRMGPAAAIVGAAAYLLSPFVLSTVNFNPVYIAALCLLAALPAVLVSVGAGQLPVRWGVGLIALAAPIVGYVYLNPPLVGMLMGVMLATPPLVGWVDGRDAGLRSFRALLIAIPLLLAASAYWIVPAILHLPVIATDQLASLPSWVWTEARASIRNAFWLNTIWTWRYPEYGPFATDYDGFPLSLLRFVLPAIAFSALILRGRSPGVEHSAQRDRLLRLSVGATTAALVIIFLSTGTNSPGSVVFDRLYGLPFGWLLREPGRFLMVVALAYALLVAVVADSLLQSQRIANLSGLRLQSLRAMRLSVVPVALGTMLFLGLPLYTGAVVPDKRPLLPAAHVRVPGYWQEMARFVDSRPTQGALLMMPPDVFYQMRYSWGYYGTDGFNVDLFHRRVLVPSAQGYAPASAQLLSAVNLTAQSILDHDWRQTEALVTALDAPLVLVRGDIQQPYAGPALVPPNDLVQALTTAPNFVLVNTIGALSLFELKTRVAESDRVSPFVTTDAQTPDLRLLSVLPPNSALVSSASKAGIPTVYESPPLKTWQDNGDSLVWQLNAPIGRSYRVVELGSSQVVSLDRPGTFTVGSSKARVVYAQTATSNLISVSIPGRPAISNGDFSTGQWGTVADCHDLLGPPGLRYLGAEVLANGAPGGLAALRLSASADSACEHQLLDWHGGPLLLGLMVHPIQGSPPRMCLWEAGPNTCAALPALPHSGGWSTYRTMLTPDRGTTAITLFLYADVNVPGTTTVNEYANVRVIEEPALETFALLGDPTGPPPSARQLAVVHSSFSSNWQGPVSSEHVLVDGMLNGWLIAPGTNGFAAYYTPTVTIRAAQWMSIGGLLLAVLLLTWAWIGRLAGRQPSRRSSNPFRHPGVSMIIDSYQPDANFVSAQQLVVRAPSQRLWEVLPQLPVALTDSRFAPIAALPLWVASVVRGEPRLQDIDLGRQPWTLREGAVLGGAISVDRVDEGKEVVLLGHHRFADFATSFYIESLGVQLSRLHSITRANFKTEGLGHLYLAGVHVFHNVYVDWMLRRLRHLAESQ